MKLLAYGLWILLSLSSVSAIWCYDCEKKFIYEKCPKKEQDRCWAGEGESCAAQYLYYGHQLLFIRLGCYRNCQYVLNPGRSLWYSFTCCNKDYCNK